MRALYLGCNELGQSEACAQSLAEGLSMNAMLRTLDLGDNLIREAGVRAVLEGVRAQQTLTALDLSSCAIGDGGAEAVARELEANGALRFARVASNEIGAEGGRALADAVDASPCETLLLDVTQNPRVAYSDLVRVRLSNCARAAAAGPNPLDGAGRADPYVS